MAGNATGIGTLSVNIEARVANLEQAFEKAARDAEKASARMQASFDAIGSVAKKVGGALGGYFTIDAFRGLIQGSLDAQDNLKDLATRAQTTVESLGGIGFAAIQSGSNVEAAAAALNKLNLSIAKAEAGDPKLAKAFKDMGVDLRDSLTGSLKTVDQILPEIIDRFQKYGDGPKTAALGNLLFKQSYASLAPLIADGSEKLRENTEFWLRNSAVTSESAGRADEFNDSMAKVNLIFERFGTELANRSVNLLQALADRFIDANDGATGMRSGIDIAIKGLENMAVDIFELINRLGSLTDAFSGVVAKAILFRETMIEVRKETSGLQILTSPTGFFADVAKQFETKSQAVDASLAARETARNAALQKFKDTLARSLKGGSPLPGGARGGRDDAPETGGRRGGGTRKESEIERLTKKLEEQTLASIHATKEATALDEVLTRIATDPKLGKATQQQLDYVKSLAAGIAALKADDAIQKRIDAMREQNQASRDAASGATELEKAQRRLAEDPGLVRASDAAKKAYLAEASAMDKLKASFNAYADIRRRQVEADEAAEEGVRRLTEGRLKSLRDATPTSKLASDRDDVQFLTEAFEEGKLELDEYIEAVQTRLGTLPSQFEKVFDEMTVFAQRAKENIQDSLGSSLRRILDGDFKSIGSAWSSLVKDMIAQAAAANLNKYLFGTDKENPFGGGAIGSIINMLRRGGGGGGSTALYSGGFGAGSGFDAPGAFGGAIAPMRFKQVNEYGVEGIHVQGKDYVMSRGPGARVTPAGAGGGAPQVTINIASGVTRPELASLVPALKAQIKAEIMTAQRRPGYAGA